MDRMRPGRMCMMRRLLVMSGFMMLGRLTVVPSGVSMMFRCLMMMFRSFLRHLASSELAFALLGFPRFIALTERREEALVPRDDVARPFFAIPIYSLNRCMA
jgi:hypothetical protein